MKSPRHLLAVSLVLVSFSVLATGCAPKEPAAPSANAIPTDPKGDKGAPSVDMKAAPAGGRPGTPPLPGAPAAPPLPGAPPGPGGK